MGVHLQLHLLYALVGNHMQLQLICRRDRPQSASLHRPRDISKKEEKELTMLLCRTVQAGLQELSGLGLANAPARNCDSNKICLNMAKGQPCYKPPKLFKSEHPTSLQEHP